MNELTMGTRRIGDFYDFYDSTPARQVLLERSPDGISLTLSWSDPSSPYARWFLGEDAFLASPSVKGSGTPLTAPSRVLFVDSQGAVLLVRCYARGFHANLLGSGRGRIWARAAVIGVEENLDFDNPHGLRTHISGLREWVGVTSWELDVPTARTVLIRALNPPSVDLGGHGGLELSLKPGWEVQPEGPDRRALVDTLACCTRSRTAEPWRDHMDVHLALRDLLVLSRWRHETCVATHVLRTDDPIRSHGGKPSDHWRNVTVPDDEPQAPPGQYQPHLIRYVDLGISGVRRWIELRGEYSRALDPIISSVQLGPATHSTRLAQVGPGVEALGYLLLRREGATRQQAKDSSLAERLGRIATDVASVVPLDAAEWVTTTTSAYNGIKHVNRAEPNSIDVLNAWRQCVLVVRAWVALELGVQPDDVRERLLRDPQRHAFGEIT